MLFSLQNVETRSSLVAVTLTLDAGHISISCTVDVIARANFTIASQKLASAVSYSFARRDPTVWAARVQPRRANFSTSVTKRLSTDDECLKGATMLYSFFWVTWNI